MSSNKNKNKKATTLAPALGNNAASTPTTRSSQPSGPPLPAVNGSPLATPIVNSNTSATTADIQKSLDKLPFVNKYDYSLIGELVNKAKAAKINNAALSVRNILTKFSDSVKGFLQQAKWSTIMDISDNNVDTIDWDFFVSKLQDLADEEQSKSLSIDEMLLLIDFTKTVSITDSEKKMTEFYDNLRLVKRLIDSSGNTHTEATVCANLYEKLQKLGTEPNTSKLLLDFIAKVLVVPQKGTVAENNSAFAKLVANTNNPSQPDAEDLEDFNYRMGRAYAWQQRTINEARNMGIVSSTSTKSDKVDKRKPSTGNKNSGHPDKKQKTSRGPCSACGNPKHDLNYCKLVELNHPNCNLKEPTKLYHESAMGKPYLTALRTAHPNMTDNRISTKHVYQGGKISETDKFRIPRGNTLNTINSTPLCHCTQCLSINTLNSDAIRESQYYPQITTNPHFININLRSGQKVIATKALLDNGAYSSSYNYINQDIANFLRDAGNEGYKSDQVVCGALSNSKCDAVTYNFDFNVNLTNEFNKQLNLQVTASAITTLYPIILGRQFIKQHSLVLNFPSHFMDTSDIHKLSSLLEGVHGVDSVNALRVDHQTYQQGDIIKKEDLLDISPEDDGGLSESLTDNLPWEIDDKDRKLTDEDFIPTNIVGSEDFINKARAICRKHINVFKREITITPAKLKPMEILVDKEKWAKLTKNRRPRIQSQQKQLEIEKQISQMLRLKVITPSDASIFSQILLTPKPGDKWRFCIDYRELNDCSQASGWPLPNIRHTLCRLGQHKAKIFGVMDLTAGFHQAPLADISKEYTAFTSWMGNFQFDRVPFGLKGAPSYYQQQIQIEVLRGFMYKVCEAYIDDIITFGKTEEEFLINLDRILERLELFGITVNPDKCRFGMSTIEYVGHTINDMGLSFTDDKLESVASFPLPDFPKQLHQFLGLMNYYRDHVRNHSDLAKPLNHMLSRTPEKQKLVWTEELSKAFDTLKYCVHNCRMIFFIDGDYAIHLCTDASLYGIGAYLYQIIDGVEKPIQFISKSLTDVQRRWSTVEKEAYAIWYALGKLEYLLRDVKFTLHTDHENLTYINDKALTSDKVYGWKLFIQHFNFDIQYIKGPDNIVADSCSRLCAFTNRENITDQQYLNSIYDFRVPEDIKSKFSEVHNGVVGHKGVKKTYKRLLDAGVPKANLESYVRKLIRQCITCQKQRHERLILNTLPFTTGTYAPMECLNIDSIGPFPKDKYGYQYVINIIDQFSRYNNLIPTKEADGYSACQALIRHTGVFGRPYQVLTDNGSQYVNDGVDQLVQILKCQQITTTAYSKEQAAIVERSNKEVDRFLISIVHDNKCADTWSDYLPLVSRIMNSSVHESIGVAPCQLITPKVALDRGMIFHKDEAMDNNNLADWMKNMLEKQDELIHIAQQIQKERDDARVIRTMQNRPPSQVPYQVGGYVLLEYPSNNNRRQGPTKLSLLRSGPYKIVAIDNRDYTLLDLVTNKEKTVDINRLKPFAYDPETTNPIMIAAQDRDDYIIERILQHQGNRSNPQFLVKWLGYEDPNDHTWEPVKNINTNEVFHKYCRDHDMLTLIPIRFRDNHEVKRRRK